MLMETLMVIMGLDCIHLMQIMLTIVNLLLKILMVNLTLPIILRSLKINQLDTNIHAPIGKIYIIKYIGFQSK